MLTKHLQQIAPIGGQPQKCFEHKATKQWGSTGKKAIDCFRATPYGQEYMCSLVYKKASVLDELAPIFEAPITTVNDKILVESPYIFEVKVQSTFTGGRTEYMCGTSPLPLKIKRFRKEYRPGWLYVDHEICPKNFIGTDLQSMFFADGAVTEGVDSSIIGERVIEATTTQLANVLNPTLLRGVTGSTTYGYFDGAVTQAFFASDPTKVYKHSVKNTIDDYTSLANGLHSLFVRVGGETVELKVDNTQQTPTGQDFINLSAVSTTYHYETVQELEDALVNYITTIEHPDNYTLRRYDAFMSNGSLFITARNYTDVIEFYITSIPCGQQPAFLCDVGDNMYGVGGIGITTEQLQCPMEFGGDVSLRLPYQKITKENAGQVVSEYMCYFNENTDPQNLLDENGAPLQVFAVMDPIDHGKLDTYKQFHLANKTNPYFVKSESFDNSNILTSESLRGTGIFFITTAKNFVPVINGLNDTLSSFFIDVCEKTSKLEFMFEMYAGIFPKCFGAIGINVDECSPFGKKLKGRTPQEVKYKNNKSYYTAGQIPCYDRDSLDCINTSAKDNCNIKGMLGQDLQVNENEDGSYTVTITPTLPADSYMDDTPSYEYSLTLADGSQITGTGPTLTFEVANIGELQSLAFELVIEASTVKCGYDKNTIVWYYDNGGMVATEQCPENVNFSWIVGDGSEQYPDTNSLYIYDVTAGYATVQYDSSNAAYIGNGIFQVMPADISTITGSQIQVSVEYNGFENIECPNVSSETTITEGQTNGTV